MTTVNKNYFKEIKKLINGLAIKGKDWDLVIMEPFHGFQVKCDGWDAVCHDGSYGHEEGLLEVMGDPVCKNEYDDVEGWLTAEDILKRLE